MKFCLFVAAMVSFLTLPVRAWNGVGHQTIAELAWRQLDENERKQVSELLKQHPHYKKMLMDDLPAGVDTNEWAFLQAAVWPDRVRPAKPGHPAKPDSVTKYDLYPHAIGHPFTLPSDTNHISLENFHIAKPNAEMVFSNSVATLRDKNASAHDRAVSLCWVIHLCGDLHQPMHAANLVTKEKPGGGGLGGSYTIMDPRTKRPNNLHSLWDQMPGVDPSYKALTTLADELSTDPGLKPAKMKEYQEHRDIVAWVQESFRYATNLGYAEGRIHYVSTSAVESGKIPTTEIPVLTADYISDAKKVARSRVVLAGQRLADILKQTW